MSIVQRMDQLLKYSYQHNKIRANLHPSPYLTWTWRLGASKSNFPKRSSWSLVLPRNFAMNILLILPPRSSPFTQTVTWSTSYVSQYSFLMFERFKKLSVGLLWITLETFRRTSLDNFSIYQTVFASLEAIKKNIYS